MPAATGDHGMDVFNKYISDGLLIIRLAQIFGVFNAIFLMKAMLEAMTDYRSKVGCYGCLNITNSRKWISRVGVTDFRHGDSLIPGCGSDMIL
ncbi:hypothetical protein MRB53_010040 [Persea americana]|uniref:Uncharacterized protein n=1 Tax=Persea americana TaxID=3435 RepID=A0ACC2LRI5_PERAE|nr:hypothetical protein MRB53_010040 [Persea americana]